MNLRWERYEEIKGKVAHYMERRNLSKVPIDPFEFAQKLGVNVAAYSSLSRAKREGLRRAGDEGVVAVSPVDGRSWIFYNDEKPCNRIRWTMFHEIGHYLLDHDDSVDDAVKEAEATFFAKYAIAPPPLIREFGAESSEDVARIFGVSREASWYVWNYYLNWLFHTCQKQLNWYDEKLCSLFNTTQCSSSFRVIVRSLGKRKDQKGCVEERRRGWKSTSAFDMKEKPSDH